MSGISVELALCLAAVMAFEGALRFSPVSFSKVILEFTPRSTEETGGFCDLSVQGSGLFLGVIPELQGDAQVTVPNRPQ